jgi:hypothetical protein
LFARILLLQQLTTLPEIKGVLALLNPNFLDLGPNEAILKRLRTIIQCLEFHHVVIDTLVRTPCLFIVPTTREENHTRIEIR